MIKIEIKNGGLVVSLDELKPRADKDDLANIIMGTWHKHGGNNETDYIRYPFLNWLIAEGWIKEDA